MRFSTYINNQKCLEWGLNANQGALFDLINQSASWAKEIVIDGVVYYWVSRNAVIEELPLFYAKPDTVYRHFVELNKKGLIVYLKHGDKDLIRLTEKGKGWNEFSSDLNPTLGNKSEQTRISIRKSSDLNPTNNNTNYKNTSDQNNTLTGISTPPKKSPKLSPLDILASYGITGKLAEDFMIHRKAKKAPITERAMAMLQKQADIAGIPITLAIDIVLAKSSWISFQADYDWRAVAVSLGWRPTTPNPQNAKANPPLDRGDIQDTTGFSAGLVVQTEEGEWQF